MGHIQQLPDDLKRIEYRMKEAMPRVTPRPAFIRDLRKKLDAQVLASRKQETLKKGLLVAGGLVGAVVMVVAIIRSLTSWKKMVETISTWYARQDKKRQAASA